MTDRYIRMAELRANYVPVAKSTLYLWISQKRFPAPYSLGGGGAVAWRESEVQEWMDSRESLAARAS
jgi:predicted DNA-binding transcriptional regulator AlpA